MHYVQKTCQIYGSRASLGLTKLRHSVASGIHQVVEVATGQHQEKKKLRPERPDALDALDASDTTCLTRTQFAMAPCIQTQLASASAYRTERVRVFSFWTQPCQGIFLLDAAMSGHFPSGRSRVRAFSFWTLPCQGKWRLDNPLSTT